MRARIGPAVHQPYFPVHDALRYLESEGWYGSPAIREHDLAQAQQLIRQHVQDFSRIDPYLLRCYGLET